MDNYYKLIIKQQVKEKSKLDNAVRIMSYNIRMAPCKEDDNTENAWKHRLPKINLILNNYLPDIVGLQEISKIQSNSILESKHKLPYKFIGKTPIKPPVESGLGFLYNSNILKLESDLKTIWLNENQLTPNAPSWDGSNYERYIIYAKFKNIKNNKSFYFLTTHFDHLGIQARQESAKIIMDLAANLNESAIITGDFNCFPQLGGADLYKLLCSHNNKIIDSTNTTKHLFGVPGSWIGWDYDIYKQKEGFAKYDYIFTTTNIKTLQHGIIDDKAQDTYINKELYPSDHRPVISDILI